MNTQIQKSKQLTIVGFGASTMRGWCEGVTEEQTFRRVLEKGLCEQGILAVVTDGGIGGDTTIDAMKRFERNVLAAEPDIVLIGIGINDSWIVEGQTEPRVPLVTYRANMQFWVDMLKARHIPIVLITLQPMTAKFDATRNLQIEKYVAVQRDIAQMGHIKVVDVYQKFTEMAERGLDLDPLYLDGQHFNVQGNKIVGEMLLDLERQSGFFSQIWKAKMQIG